MNRIITITIDGPSGTGKSSVARLLAQRLGFDYLDTGAMYRAAAYLAVITGIDLSDETAIASAIEKSQLHFNWETDPPRLIIEWPEHQDISDKIREPDITAGSSAVAGLKEVRAALRIRQQQIRAAHPQLVTEGRDQGSAVFKDAELKFYLDAQPEIRANRRALQLQKAGKNNVDLNEILTSIQKRDNADSSRKDDPLVIPDGAIVIDTSNMSKAEVVNTLENYYKNYCQKQQKLYDTNNPQVDDL